MTQEELAKLTEIGTRGACVYFTEGYDAVVEGNAVKINKGDIATVDALDTGKKELEVFCKSIHYHPATIVPMDICKLVDKTKGKLIVKKLGHEKSGCSIARYNKLHLSKQINVGDIIDNYTHDGTHIYMIEPKEKGYCWFTEIQDFRFVPNEELTPVSEKQEEVIPTPLKAVKQATGLSIGSSYTYTPNDNQNEFMGIVEAFLITSKGIFIVDCTGNYIPANKCKKTK